MTDVGVAAGMGHLANRCSVVEQLLLGAVHSKITKVGQYRGLGDPVKDAAGVTFAQVNLCCHVAQADISRQVVAQVSVDDVRYRFLATDHRLRQWFDMSAESSGHIEDKSDGLTAHEGP